MGFPIRISSDQSLLATPRSFSQHATSFIASMRQGIHQMPLKRLISALRVVHRSQIRFICCRRLSSHSLGRPLALPQLRLKPSPAVQQETIQKHHLNKQQTHQSNNHSQQLFKIEHYPWIFRSSRTRTSTVRMYSFPLHNIK